MGPGERPHHGWTMVTPTPTVSQSFLSFRMLQNFSTLLKFLLMMYLCQIVYSRPRPDEKLDTKSISIVDKIENPELVGGNIDLLISDMYNRIIRERLENLLEGVSPPMQQQFGEELLKSSDPLKHSEEINKNSAFEEQEEFVEISLPISITEIPRELFTSLPGTI